MLAGLDDAGVGVAERRVFAGDGDGDVFLGLADAIDEPAPFHAGLVFGSLIDAVVQVEQREHFAVHARSRSASGIV